MKWKKDEDMKYTDMCIFIDANVGMLIDPDCPEELADTIYKYLWLLVKALAIKKRMFQSFSDYDGYAFYAANRLFLALRKNLENQGKTIKGKKIKPIKSCLNYTKALLYPMKLEYLRETQDLSLTAAKTAQLFDSFIYKQKLGTTAWYQHGGYDDFKNSVSILFQQISLLIDQVLQKAPFRPNTADYKNLKISILLNILENFRTNKNLFDMPQQPVLWHLPKSMTNFVGLYLQKIGLELKVEIMKNFDSTQIDEHIIDYMITNPTGEFKDKYES